MHTYYVVGARRAPSTLSTFPRIGGQDVSPDGHVRLELTKFHAPAAVRVEPKNAPVNTLGIRRLIFAGDDIEDVVARLRAHGAALDGEVAQYEDLYRLCFIRGSQDLIGALAEQLG